MIAAAFDLAYFWRCNPQTIFALTLDEFELYQQHAGRIADAITKKR